MAIRVGGVDGGIVEADEEGCGGHLCGDGAGGGFSRERKDCLKKKVVVERVLNMEGHFDGGGRYDTHGMFCSKAHKVVEHIVEPYDSS